MQHKLLVYIYDKSMTGSRGISLDNFAGKKIIVCDCNWTRTHNHLVHKRTLNHLAKLAK